MYSIGKISELAVEGKEGCFIGRFPGKGDPWFSRNFEVGRQLLNSDMKADSLPHAHKQETQKKFRFACIPSIEQMGTLVAGKKMILLQGRFLFDILQPRQYYSNYENPDEEPFNTICLFCKQGNLQLKRVEPILSSLGNPPSSRRHIGNRYEYRCANDKVYPAVFLGELEFNGAH